MQKAPGAIMKGHIFRLEKDRLRSSAVSFGWGDSDPFLIARSGQHIVVRKPSSRDWSQCGSSAGHPAEWLLLRVEWLAGERLRVLEEVETHKPGRFWRRTRVALLDALEWNEQKLGTQANRRV